MSENCCFVFFFPLSITIRKHYSFATRDCVRWQERKNSVYIERKKPCIVVIRKFFCQSVACEEKKRMLWNACIDLGPLSLSLSLSLCLSVCLSVCLSLSLCLSLCVSVLHICISFSFFFFLILYYLLAIQNMFPFPYYYSFTLSLYSIHTYQCLALVRTLQHPPHVDPKSASSPWYLGKSTADHVQMVLSLRPPGQFVVYDGSPPDELYLAYRCIKKI